MRRGGVLRLAAAMLLAAAVPAAAAPAPGPGATLLQLSETAERAVPRDRLTILMRIEASGSDRVAVQAELNRRMAAALDKVAAAAVEAASGSYQAEERSPLRPDGKPGPTQWHALQDLALSGGDFAALLRLAGALQADGLTIADMTFDVAPATLRAAQRALTEAALQALTARARDIAAALGLKVARIVSLRVGNAMPPAAGVRPVMMAARAGDAVPPPAAAAGTGTVTLSADAEVALVPEK